MYSPRIIELIELLALLLLMAILAKVVRGISRRRKLKDLAQDLGGRVVAGLFRQSAYIPNQGIETRIETRPSSIFKPKYLILEQPCRIGFKLTIDKIEPLLNFTSRTGFELTKYKREPALHTAVRMMDGCERLDPQPECLNGHALARASDLTMASNFLMDPKKRMAVGFFLKEGFFEIVAANDKLVLKKPDYSDNDLAPARVKETLRQMKEFSGEQTGP